MMEGVVRGKGGKTEISGFEGDGKDGDGVSWKRGKAHQRSGQDLGEFSIGELVELVPLAGSAVYLPMGGEWKRGSKLFHLKGVQRGMVVRKWMTHTRELFQAKDEARIARHGDVEVMEVLVGGAEVVVGVYGIACDFRRSYGVRKLVGEE